MTAKKRFENDRLQRGVFLLPNILTTLNLFCGFYSIVAAIEGDFIASAVAIIVSGGFDTLDGRIARATNTTSRFGVEYDSMADLISFGLAPGLLLYLWALRPLGHIGWLAAFLFTACGALRLARYNVQSEVSNDSGGSFVGLPITAAAGMAAVSVLFSFRVDIDVSANPYFILLVLYVLSFLMVSAVKYASFKDNDLFKGMRFNILVRSLLVFIFVAAQPSIALFVFGLFYVLSGPVGAVLHNKTPQFEKTKVSDSLDQN